jgi:hypothetical protein
MTESHTPPTGDINLTNSMRSVNKATYAPAVLPAGTPPPGQVLEKAAYLRRLALTEPEVDALQEQVGAQGQGSVVAPETLNLAAKLARSPGSEGLRQYGLQLARTSRQDLTNLGRALAAVRRNTASGAADTAPGSTPAAAPPSPEQGPVMSRAGTADLAAVTQAAVDAFERHMPVQPVGALHLERLEMTPVGVEHGELVHSVPLTPHETVNISHREWTVTTQTFESIVTDSFEGFSETGVTDKTDLSQAIENETKHDTSLDVNGSVTATYNGGAYSVTAAAAVDYSDKNSVQNTIKQSIAHSQTVTRHASARTRKDHKTSFKVSSVAGAEDLAVRTLTNPTDKAIRVDYFQMIRKWRVDLIRYGLRLTYDLVIPDPALDMIGRVKELQELEEWLSTATFVFDQPIEEITADQDAWLKLETKYGIALDPPPPPTKTVNIGQTVGKQDGNVFDLLALDVPADYKLTSGSLEMTVHGDGDHAWAIIAGRPLTIPPGGTQHDIALIPPLDLGTRFSGQQGHFTIPWGGGNFDFAQFTGNFTASVLPEVQAAWRSKTWLALHDYAQERFNKILELANQRKAYLEDLISRFDALTLRKMEHEEVMKWVLDWLLPTGFPLTPNPIDKFGRPWQYPEPGIAQPSLPVPDQPIVGLQAQWLEPNARATMGEYGDYIKFLQNAIEWENMLFFVYPYFWDAYENWQFKRFLVHPDPVHREFLRGGAARVVLTVRPGYEDAFTRFVLTGDPESDQIPAASLPYVSLGQEVRNQAYTNYENIPPANPDHTARPLLYALQRQAWDDMQAIIAALTEFNLKKGHYPPGPETGLPHTLKTFLLSEPQTDPAGNPTWAARLWAQLRAVSAPPNYDDPKAVFIDPWRNPYHYKTPSATTQVLHGDYELVSYGSNNAPGTDPSDPLSDDITSWAEGLLVAQWFEYTPTSALDVAVDATMPAGGPPLAG